MQHQHIENLFRRFKGEIVNIRTLSGGIYEGKVTEVTNDYVCIVRTGDLESGEVYVLFDSIESMAGRSTTA